MLSAEALGGAVWHAVQDTLGDYRGGQVLQAALPALRAFGYNISRGDYDEEAWRNASECLRKTPGVGETGPGINDANEDGIRSAIRAMSGLRKLRTGPRVDGDGDGAGNGDGNGVGGDDREKRRLRWKHADPKSLLWGVSEALASEWSTVAAGVQREALESP